MTEILLQEHSGVTKNRCSSVWRREENGRKKKKKKKERLCAPVRTSPMPAMSSKKEGYFKICTNRTCISDYDRHGSPDRPRRFDEGCVAGKPPLDRGNFPY